MSHLMLRTAAPVSIYAKASAAGIVMLAVATACNKPNADRSPPGSSQSGKQTAAAPLPQQGLTNRAMADHWMQTPELKALMQRLGQAADASRPRPEDDPEQPPTPAELERTFAYAAALADQLSKASRDIPDAAAWLRLSAEDRRGFVAEAESLGKYAAQLRQDAAARRTDAMDRTLTQINATCVTCHTRYRDRSGVVDPFQASAGGRPSVGIIASAGR